MKFSILAIIFILLIINVSAQETKSQTNILTEKKSYFLSINQPIGLLSKFRIKFENRFITDNSILFTYTNYYLIYPGNQFYAELRKYNNGSGIENFKQIKLGVGESEKFANIYVFLGVAKGQKIYLSKSKKVSLDITEGLKLPLIVKGDPEDNAPKGLGGLFFITGPGSIFDINFNFSFQF
jgi:hypothetical protein